MTLARIADCVTSAIAEHETDRDAGSMWKTPILGTIPSDDPRFGSLKKLVSPSHLTPEEILPGAKSVICFFIPFREGICESNVAGRLASREWASAYVRTNELIASIYGKIETCLGFEGNRSGIVPSARSFDVRRLTSDWSQRHLAYLAGIGTFGINNMLITEQGCCGRFGSLVTDHEFPSPDRKILSEKCLRKRDGSCGLCREKCVVDAFADDSFNRGKCHRMCLENASIHTSIGYADVCGKCLVGLPCSSRDPRR